MRRISAVGLFYWRLRKCETRFAESQEVHSLLAWSQKEPPYASSWAGKILEYIDYTRTCSWRFAREWYFNQSTEHGIEDLCWKSRNNYSVKPISKCENRRSSMQQQHLDYFMEHIASQWEENLKIKRTEDIFITNSSLNVPFFEKVINELCQLNFAGPTLCSVVLLKTKIICL